MPSGNLEEETRKIEKDPIKERIVESFKNPERLNELIADHWTRLNIDDAPVIVGESLADILQGLRFERLFNEDGTLFDPRVRTFIVIKRKSKPPIVDEEQFIAGSNAALAKEKPSALRARF